MKDLKLFYEEQIELLAAKNGAALVEAHYADNAEMIVNTGDDPIIKKGKTELTQLFEYYLSNVYRGFISTEKFAATDDSIMFEATIQTVDGTLKIYDCMYLEGGKITRHFSGAK
jgi:hypothetical protein